MVSDRAGAIGFTQQRRTQQAGLPGSAVDQRACACRGQGRDRCAIQPAEGMRGGVGDADHVPGLRGGFRSRKRSTGLPVLKAVSVAVARAPPRAGRAVIGVDLDELTRYIQLFNPVMAWSRPLAGDGERADQRC